MLLPQSPHKTQRNNIPDVRRMLPQPIPREASNGKFELTAFQNVVTTSNQSCHTQQILMILP